MWSDPETSRALVAQIPMGRWADVEELAGPLRLLASDAGSYITGTTLVRVDGGSWRDPAGSDLCWADGRLAAGPGDPAAVRDPRGPDRGAGVGAARPGPGRGADDLELVLVERPGHLRQHAGQVGLPGGAVEPGDADGAAALREAQEEIGLDPSGVRVLGSLDRAYLAVSTSTCCRWLASGTAWPASPAGQGRHRAGRPCASWPATPTTARWPSGTSWA